MRTAVSTLGAAVAAALFSTVSLAGEVPSQDPSLELTYKNYVWKDRAGDPAMKYSDDEWVHALIATFDTGYINHLGVVVTGGVANPLYTDNVGNFSHVPQKANGKGQTIGGFQQGYLKGRYDWDDFSFNGTLGVKKRDYKLFSDSGSRVLAASSRGLDISGDYKDLDLYFSYITGASPRNHSRFSGDLTAGYLAGVGGDEKVDSIGIVGANYSIAGFDFAIEYMDADKLLRKNFYQGVYTWELAQDTSLVFDLHYGQARAAGPLYVNPVNSITDPGYRSSYYLFNTRFNLGGAYANIGYGKTMDGRWNFFSNGAYNAGSFSQPAEWVSYNFEGETSYLLGAGYDFSGVGLSGLHWDVALGLGTSAEKFEHFKQREWGSYMSYAFGGKLEGLSVGWLYAKHKLNITPKADGHIVQQEDLVGRNDINEFSLQYTMKVF